MQKFAPVLLLVLSASCSRQPHSFPARLEWGSILISSPASGTVIRIQAQPGAPIRAYEPIFTLRPDPSSAITKLRRPLVNAHATALLAKGIHVALDCQRLELARLADAEYVKALKNQDVRPSADPPHLAAAISVRDLVTRITQTNEPNRCVDLMTGQARKLRLNDPEFAVPKEDIEITAPAEGQLEPRVGLPNMAAGARIRAGQTVAILLLPQNPEAVATVPAWLARELKPGQSVSVLATPPIAGQIRSISEPDLGPSATVLGAGPARGRSTVRVNLAQSPPGLAPGAPLTITLP